MSPGSYSPARDCVRLIVGDKQPLVRRGLRAIFDSELDFEVVDEVSDGERLFGLISRRRPSVIVLDTALTGVDSLELARQFAGDENIDCGVVLVADRLDTDFAIAALRAGARGLLYKDDNPEDLVRAIRAVAAGEALLMPRVTRQVLDGLRHGSAAPSPHHADQVAIDGLTPRELQVFRMIAEGRSNRQIADLLLLSEATVKSHFNRIGKKLGIRGRAQAVIMAYKVGLVRTAG
jgi:DNA-binding NarL/FixJ family response regulator